MAAKPIKSLTCSACGYILKGLRTNRCPECGKAFDPNALPQSRLRAMNFERWSYWVNAFGAVSVAALIVATDENVPDTLALLGFAAFNTIPFGLLALLTRLLRASREAAGALLITSGLLLIMAIGVLYHDLVASRGRMLSGLMVIAFPIFCAAPAVFFGMLVAIGLWFGRR